MAINLGLRFACVFAGNSVSSCYACLSIPVVLRKRSLVCVRYSIAEGCQEQSASLFSSTPIVVCVVQYVQYKYYERTAPLRPGVPVEFASVEESLHSFYL